MKNKSPIRMIRLFLIAISCAIASCLTAQNPSLEVFEEWTALGGYLTFHQKNRTITDASGNVYVAGTTRNVFGNYDMLTAKYSSTGTLLWQTVYSGAGGGDDGAADVLTDWLGNVYVTGSYYKNSTDSNNAITIKYNSSGVQQWMQEYNGAGSRNDATVRLEIDGVNLYAVGSAYSGTSDQYDFLVIKYDLLGNQAWASVWDNAGLLDGAVRIRVKNSKVTVAGGSQVNATQYKYAVANFSVLTGTFLNAHTSGGNQPISFDKVTDLLVDNNGDVFITGGVQNSGVGYDIRTVKLDQQNLGVQWSATYNGSSNLDDVGNSIVQDASGNIYVTGFETVTGQGKNYVTIKYANSNGAVQWTKLYNDADNGDDEAAVIGVQGSSRVYVTGAAFNGSTLDYYTIGYDASNGNLIWEIGYNGLANLDDRAADLSVLGNGELIVTGTAFENPIKAKYVTVKYVEKNVMLPNDTIPGTSNSYVFVQNNGQLVGSDSSTHPEVKFYTTTASPKVYFMDTAVSYVFARIDTSVNQNDSTRRVDMKFNNANGNLKIRPMKIQDPYSNYFLGHIPDGRSRVPQYSQLISFNVWNNVNMIFGSNYNGLKYYFISQPGGGGNPMMQIDLKYEGADSVTIGSNGELIVHTKLGNIIQPKAAAWQLDANGNYQSLGWQPSYTMLGTNEVGFTGFGTYNSSLPIVFAIDWGNSQPQNIANISWSTFFGDGLFSLFNDMRTSNSGEIVVTGTTTSATFPATPLAIYNSPQGQRDAVVVKFHANGALDWATYYGGANLEYGNGVDVDVTTGNVFFVGETRSYNFPTFVWGGAEYNGPPANATNPEQFIVQLSSNGQNAVWATCYGGTGLDAANDIRISNSGVNSGDIYVVGKGTTSFPQYSQPAWADGNGTVLRFDDDGVLLMATRFGSSGGGELHDVTIDEDGDVVVVGWVPSGSGVPIQNAGGNSSYGGGVADGVICKFSGANASIWWCTYYGGNDDDAALSIETFKTPTSHFYYVSGRTLSTSGLPVVNPGYGYYQGSSGGSNDAFVVQISSWGYFMWSTYYGGSGNDYGWSITADPSQNVYLVGQTGSTNLPFPASNLASGYVDGAKNGLWDGFIVCFRKVTNDQVWTTYFGGNYEDMIYSGACDGNDYLYVTGSTNTHSSFPLDNGGGIPYYDASAPGLQGFITQFEIDEIVADVGEPGPHGELMIYPNPADQTLCIATGCENCESKIVIQDILGQVVYSENNTSGSELITIDVGMLASGSYIVSVEAGDSVSNVKLIIQH